MSALLLVVAVGAFLWLAKQIVLHVWHSGLRGKAMIALAVAAVIYAYGPVYLGALERVGFDLADTGIKPDPKTSQLARREIPTRYLALYQQAGKRYGVPWQYLAAIGKKESDHGRLRLPGVRSGLNRYRDKHGRWRSCCAGPMQFNLVNGPPSTWDTYGKGGSPYKPEHAIPAAARLLVANGARGNMDKAIYAYHHSWTYVSDVKAWVHRYKTGRFS